jgi:hypothetical protein
MENGSNGYKSFSNLFSITMSTTFFQATVLIHGQEIYPLQCKHQYQHNHNSQI